MAGVGGRARRGVEATRIPVACASGFLDEHLPDAFADEDDRALHVDGQHRIDLVVAGGRQDALVGDRRIGYAVVDPAEPGCHAGHKALNRGRVGGIELLNVKPIRMARGESHDRV